MQMLKILGVASFLVSSTLGAESLPSIEITNYPNELAYIMTSPEVVVGKDYQDACKHLSHLGYTWKIVPKTDANPACYSPTNNKHIGADTWFCADGSLAYYNIPWWYCPSFKACPSPEWSLTADKLHCTKKSRSCSANITNVSEFQIVAAIVYGEASTSAGYEELAAIANALIRKRDSYKDEDGNLKYPTVNQLLIRYPDFSYAYKDKVERYQIALCADIEIEYPLLYAAVANAFDPEGIDYANGGCYWDGKDLKTKGKHHPHYKDGYKFTDPDHDVLSVGDTPKMRHKRRGKIWYYTYESTAGYGKTVFWKTTPEFRRATGAPQCH